MKKDTYQFKNCTFFGTKWLKNNVNGNGVYEVYFAYGKLFEYARIKQDVHLNMYDSFSCSVEYKGKNKTMYIYDVKKDGNENE